MNRRFVPALIASALALSGCQSPPPRQVTEEERQMMQLVLERMKGGAKQALARQEESPRTTAQNAPTISEDELRQKIATIPAVTNGVRFDARRDGFDANGRRYLDPEGAITRFGTDYASGNVTYLVQGMRGEHTIKFARATVNSEPLVIGTAIQEGGEWSIQTATGKKFTGEQLLLTSDGFVVTREAAAFRYTAGNGTQNFAPPQNFRIADFQNGDISGTGYILVERVKRPGEGRDLLSTVKALGNTLGATQQEDYALVDLAGGKLFPINIGIDDKEANFLSGCRKKNTWVNECANMVSRESLYKQNGVKNHGHYYWRINWFKTASGPVLIAQENGLADITLTNLTTGKKVTAYSYVLGIRGFDAEQDSTGRVRLTIRAGLGEEVIDDVERFMAEKS